MGTFREKSKKWGIRMIAGTAMLFCVAALAVLPAKEVMAQATGTVTASSANIREKADVNSDVVASVLNGNKLTITEQVTGADGKTWYKVFIDADSMGYIRADLMSKGEGSVPTGTSQQTTTTTTTTTPSTNTTPQVNTSVAVNLDGVEAVQPVSASVTKDNVRVRSDNSTNSDIVTTVKKEIALTVHGTKVNANNETWYQVSFNVNGAEVKGYIRSDFVNLGGELQPVVDTPPVEDVAQEPVQEEPPVVEDADYKVSEQDDVWYLIDNTGEQQYQYKISSLITGAEKNAEELEKAQKKISKQTGLIVFMAIVLVVLILGVTLLIFKLKDMMEDEGFDREASALRNRAPQGNRPQGSRPAGARPAGASQGSRPTGAQQGNRPAGASQGSRPTGARPAGASQGARPAGARPTGASQGARPAGARPTGASQGARPANGSGRQPVARPTGAPQGSRPAGTSQSSRPAAKPIATDMENAAADRQTIAGVSEAKLTNQARANVEARGLEKETVKSPTWQSKNFMADEEEFEFEFLNWDGEEEN